MYTRRFAYLLGIIFIVLGVLGFVPGFYIHHMADDFYLTVTGYGTGKLFNLFHINWVANLVHILFGILGIVMARNGQARLYCRIISVIFLLVGLIGMIPRGNTWKIGGLVPLEGNNVWLHIVIAFVAGWFGWLMEQPTLPPEEGMHHAPHVA